MTKVSDLTGDLISRAQIFHGARLLGNLSMAMVDGINCIGKWQWNLIKMHIYTYPLSGVVSFLQYTR